MFVLGQKGLSKISLVVVVSFVLCAEEIHAAARQSDPMTNPNWKKLGGKLSQVDIGPLGAIWGVNKHNHMFVLNGNNWTPINGAWKHVSPGESGVWAVNNGDQVYYREGVTLSSHMGTSWTHVGGSLVQIDSGPFGVVYGVNKHNKVFCRDKISPKSPFGTKWILVPASGYKILTVSCALYGCWAITDKKQILFLRGTSGKNCKGQFRWTNIPVLVKMKQIEVDHCGVAYAVDVNDGLWVRKLVSTFRPSGSHFEKIPDTKVTYVSAGFEKIIALAKDGTIYQFQGNWHIIPQVKIKQIDTGMTKDVWGVNQHNEVYRLERSINRWKYIGKDMKYVSSGGAGVWGINNQDDVVYRIAGNNWFKVGVKNLAVIDSGPYGIVYGVNANGDVFCRDGITPGKPTGDAWRKLKKPSNLSYVSCGAFGCWGANKAGGIWYRHGVSIHNCNGTRWTQVVHAKSMHHKILKIDVGADGNVCGPDAHGQMLHRVGVSSSNLLGTKWMTMLHGVLDVTTGVSGQYVVVTGGATYHTSDHKFLH